MRVDEIKEHLSKDLIPFWKSLKDDEFGGFYGEIDFDLNLSKRADKGGILNSRILWFFSNAYLTLQDETCLSYAKHAYDFLRKVFLDQENGGVFWSVTYDGKPADDTKHTYNQAFAIYGLASYYDAAGDKEALSLAYTLMDKIEDKCRDNIGYLEAFDRCFQPASNEKLSENGVMASRTMNTLLHVLEAYTEVYRVDKNAMVADKMRWMLTIFADQIYNPAKRRLEVFFDWDMNSLLDLNSYGHDIEASWLVDRSVEILKDPVYLARIAPVTRELTAHIHSVAMDETSLYNECEDGNLDTKKVWWVQAEAILGFLNGYQKDPSKVEYLESAGKIWDFIKVYMIDPREGSEWFFELTKEGTPMSTRGIVGPWKCPYHNGRMCFEIINRNITF
ncbi:MAG: N-acyl-D-glucosamine 2-epimerase [Firmicutes bacterium]|nr:N-acyl-D-glucosamine 2-epimerase [Bacillota bacterium]